jgi:ATP-dependent helicase Lhr and Lhr-like helicase
MGDSQSKALRYLNGWFRRLKRKPFSFQRATSAAYLQGESGLVHSPTGTGKTLAVFLGPVLEWLAEHPNHLKKIGEPDTELPPIRKPEAVRSQGLQKLRVLWITPLRALASDTEVNLNTVVHQLQIPWSVEKRTGDTSSYVRQKQRERYPEVLITTPESLSLMLCNADLPEKLSDLRCVVVDEWHELLSSKRGVQTELGLARLRNIRPDLRVWGLSATLGNLEEAVATLLGNATGHPGVLIASEVKKKYVIDSLIPVEIERFPWAGHLGTRLVPEVAKIIAEAQSTLVFTNTRSQCEIWYQALLKEMPGLSGRMAVHHGSLDIELRRWVENGLREGRLKCCVCTSSLDLGVDFSEVDRVVQVGSPKGNARLLQRAGRSGHKPGVPSRITFVPTNAMELMELAAVRDALLAHKIEPRHPMKKPLDFLAQHVVTVAIGGGFRPQELFEEVRTTTAYQDLTDLEWQWVLDFARQGGSSLKAYPDFHRIRMVDGMYHVTDDRTARFHRLSIGTIVSDVAVQVKYMRGAKLGTVEESFIGKIRPGETFMLGGKLLELVRLHDNTAWVRRAKGVSKAIPRWLGGRIPLSGELSQAMREKIAEAREARFASPEMRSLMPLLDLQSTWSALPDTNQLLIERFKNRDGHHLFLYPFAGRLAHEGLASILALRMSRLAPITFSMAMNDYGLVLVSREPAPFDESLRHDLWNTEHVADDVLASLNATELCKRQFREIARVAGLIFQGYPGVRKSGRQIQASSNLFYDVFLEYDPENLLLRQARREVLEQQLEYSRLVDALNRIARSELLISHLQRPSPLSFPLLVDGMRDRLTSEKLWDRVRKMQEQLEQAAGRDPLAAAR